MTKEDVLWVAIKVFGLYLIVQGVASIGAFVIARMSSMSISGSGGTLVLSTLVPLVIGVYLLADGAAVLSFATRRGTGSSSGPGDASA